MIYTAGMVTFLRTILIIALVYYGLKLVVKYLFPILIKRFVNKQQERFNQQQSASNNTEPNSHKRNTDSKKETLGDYVDYEEVD